jgi:DNA-binding NtrC family response regulator
MPSEKVLIVDDEKLVRWSLRQKNAVERAMLLEEGDVLRSTYMPFAVAQQQAPTLRLKCHLAAAATAETLLSCPMAAVCPSFLFPRAAHRSKKLSAVLVEVALTQANGNQTHAARLLDISRDALRYKLKKFGLIHAEEDETSTAPS